MKANIPERTYYKIGEVSSILGVKPHIVRYWVSEFPQIRPKKTKSGQRLFTRRDIDLLLAIERLIIGEEYTASGAKTRLQELRARGIEDHALYDAIQKLQNADLIDQVLAEPKPAEHQHKQSPQENLRFDPEEHQNTTAREIQHRTDAAQMNATAKIDELQRALELREHQLETLTAAHAHQREMDARIRQKLQERAEAAEAQIQAEQAALKRRIELTQKSVLEERQFFADEQHILTLYIEELEESLFEAKERARIAEDARNEANRQVQSRAMQQRYALRKSAHNAKRQRNVNTHVKHLASRIQQRVHEQRTLTGQMTRDDSD